MSDYLTEDQQVEVLKKFWKENGFTIVASIIIAILIVTGIRFYRGYVRSRAEHASVVYQRMMGADGTGDTKEAQKEAHLLIKNYHATPYSTLAALMLAKQFVAHQKYDDAILQLHWVIDHARSKSFSQIARIRLARIYLEQKKPQETLTTLETTTDQTFSGLVNEIRGDAYLVLNQPKKARRAYQSALNTDKTNLMERPLLQMKLNDTN